MHTKPTAPNPPAMHLPRAIRTHECTEADKLLQIHAGPSGPGGAPVFYQITMPNIVDDRVLGSASVMLSFQQGPICENGLNGITIESLLAVAEDRLDCFQHGSYPCEENATALYWIRQARTALHNRTRRRQREHAEGTSKADAPDGAVSAQSSARCSHQPPSLRCHCRNVAMGSHEMSVAVPTPEFLRGTFGCKTNKDVVSIDLCIVPEILWLWSKGVITHGSCCGHGKQAATICVDDSSIATMHELGYQLYPDHPHVFYSRSIPRHDVQPPRVSVSDDSLEQLLFDLAKRAGSLPSGPDQDWALHFSNRLRHILSNQSISEPATHPTNQLQIHVPDQCPITGRKYFADMTYPELGLVPTFGGPFDSYTIPVPVQDDEFSEAKEFRCLHFDHDRGAWGEDCGTSLYLVTRETLLELYEFRDAKADSGDVSSSGAEP